MAGGVGVKEKRSYTLSVPVTMGIQLTAKEQNISQSALVDRILDAYLQRKKEKEMREGYEALRDVSKSIARASKSLQKKVILDY